MTLRFISKAENVLRRTDKPRLDVGRLLKSMGPGLTAEEAAAVLYMPEKTINKWIRRPHTKLDPYEADKLASHIGLHPFNVWSWDWIDTK